MATSTASLKHAEIKARTTPEIRDRARTVYARWGITLNDAINMFLAKSVEVGGLPFELRPKRPSFAELSAMAYKAPLDEHGIAVLPASWDDGDE